MSKTTTVSEPEVTAAELAAEIQRLSYAVSLGDGVALIRLIKLEEKREATQRQAQRAIAAEAEGQRLAVIATEEASQVERQAKEARHADFQGQRLQVLTEIQKTTESLAREVDLALQLDAECWALALQLGWSPERRTSSRISAYLSTQLGREGAGLSDMPMVPAGLRGPLVQPSKES
jgi:uncharacterized protein YfaS (alpha-2-macroglobulin family)